MKKLGDIELMESMEWDNFGQSVGVGTVHRLALDGTLITFSGPATRQIVLQAGEDYGWVSADKALALMALAASTISTALTWGGQVIPVRFDHSSGPAVALSPLYPGAEWYTGTISLIRED